jgi:uncharacterized protein YwgA
MSEDMDRVEVLGGLLRRIGNFGPRNFQKNFNDRLILQKTIYLMQEFDLYIGYEFNWYLKGPYSPSLTKDAFELVNSYKETTSINFIDPEAEERFQEFLNFINNHVKDEYWLEAIASIHYLRKNYPDWDKKRVNKEVKKKMPNIKSADFKEYWDYLLSYGLVEGGD